MNREKASQIAHAHHPIKAPLDDGSVRRLLGHALPRGDERVLDLGCGTGEWLLRALEAGPGVRADGVDISADALDHARRAATDRGVQERLDVHLGKAEDFAPGRTFDVVLSVGAAHAFGGLLPTLAAARAHLAPGGRVVIGDGFWDRPPSPEAVEMLGDFADLATTMDLVAEAGWTPVHGHVSSRGELDDYEWACWGTLADWALDHPDDPDSADALALAGIRRTEWLRTYRDTWGFLTLVLRRTVD
ncbi:Methyltransferase domain-containing protein [Asanoa hainanensis]|uniref:Methyltransferase domain-containing protein n=1 Tax=Asanoa hainanensis TaxID=560556 RepID=A0A239P6V6_9ACTN|nr:class I SAM-dependent methyltransferase [Asanoa hainanensis]SNT62682.1 Methyltransferase domain-containing protein [Asanoa hainanensis]